MSKETFATLDGIRKREYHWMPVPHIHGNASCCGLASDLAYALDDIERLNGLCETKDLAIQGLSELNTQSRATITRLQAIEQRAREYAESVSAGMDGDVTQLTTDRAIGQYILTGERHG